MDRGIDMLRQSSSQRPVGEDAKAVPNALFHAVQVAAVHRRFVENIEAHRLANASGLAIAGSRRATALERRSEFCLLFRVANRDIEALLDPAFRRIIRLAGGRVRPN